MLPSAGGEYGVTTGTEPKFLQEQAVRFRGLAREIVDDHGRKALLALAEEYEIRAAEADANKKVSE